MRPRGKGREVRRRIPLYCCSSRPYVYHQTCGTHPPGDDNVKLEAEKQAHLEVNGLSGAAADGTAAESAH